ncbi:hypothetical protein G6F37_012007 [Rhizopus arrhizus]|nr:hypothetical protein G6F37_012007 [Rhizopus arrhizus]
MRTSSILASLAALTSSSCCIIQLVLNYFSFSCAGFSILTPYRPFLTCLTILILTYQLYHCRCRPLLVLLCLILTLSPEIVRWMNRLGSAPNLEEYYIQLIGLGCEACANRIKRQLESVDWITHVRVYFNNATAIVSTKQQPESVIALIESIDSRYRAQLL